MVIYLEWWAAPLIVFIIGCVISYFVSATGDSGGYLPDPTGAFIFIGTLIATICLLIGHFV